MKKGLIKIGSETAKNGFENENDVIKRFNNWKTDKFASKWLEAMNYKLDEIESVTAIKVKGSFKTDVQVQISLEVKLKKLLDVQNLQVKLVSNPSGFNQIDKRWVDKYVELWSIPKNIELILKHFTGEILPTSEGLKDSRRMFLNEFSTDNQKQILDFFRKNKSLIISDILKGRGQFASEWMLVILKLKNQEIKWSLKPINYCLNLFGNGVIEITKLGSLKIGNITMQRKGGDGGRKTSQMLQFKINPCLLFDEIE